MRRSLEFRLCILIAGLLFVLLYAVARIQMAQQKTALFAKEVDKYQTIATVLAMEYGALSTGHDSHIYQGLCSGLLSADSNITFVIVSDPKGNVVAASARGLEPSKIDNFVGKQSAELSGHLRRIGVADADRYSTSAPAMTGRGKVGMISVGFNSQALKAAAEEIWIRLLSTFTIALLVGMFGAILLSKAVMNPVRRLITAIRAVRDGDLDAEVPVMSNDEIGELGFTFNSMVEALKDSHGSLVQKANTDSLTGLCNHRCFHERLSAELARASRYDRPFSILMMDIDHFKTLNDTHGHPFGDVVLREVGKILIRELREMDVVARYGGEEFAMILPETRAKDALIAAERLRKSIQTHAFAFDEGVNVPVTVSMGVAQFPVHSTEREGLITAADLAMYESKSLGRNRVTVFSRDISTTQAPDPCKVYLMLHAKDLSTLEAMAAAVDTKVKRYSEFSRDVMTHCLAVADLLELSESDKNDLRIASLLHDIGKLGIPEEVLTKAGPLTDEEWKLIQTHPALGSAIVQEATHLKSMLPGILHHHECWDGSGYPNNLKGEEIPLIARIIAVVDAYHAMITERTYARANSKEYAVSELQRCAGTQFDPNIVDAFLTVLRTEADPRMEQAA